MAGISPAEFIETALPAVTETPLAKGIELTNCVGEDEIVPKDNWPEPLVCKTWLAEPSACGQFNPSRTILPVPFGAIDIFPLTPSAIVIDPELVPEFVFNIKSPVPLVVRVALALLSPILTVSASSWTSPVPFGASTIFPFEVEIIDFPLTSKSLASVGPDKFAFTSTTFVPSE